MSYSKFIEFGQATNNNVKNPGDPSNPLTYCIWDTESVQFMHGPTAAFYKPQCYECQSYMALRCAGKYDENETWDDYCETYRQVNTDTYWPNQAAILKIPACVISMCGKLTQGDILLRNAAERRFLYFPNCAREYIQFDPNVAASPMIEKPYSACGCDYSSAGVSINKRTINNDRLMNKCLENCKIVADIFAVLYKEMKRGAVDLSGTKVGAHLNKYARFYEQVLAMITNANPMKRFMGNCNPVPQYVQNRCAFTRDSPSSLQCPNYVHKPLPPLEPKM